jgi:hypothetical protein
LKFSINKSDSLAEKHLLEALLLLQREYRPKLGRQAEMDEPGRPQALSHGHRGLAGSTTGGGVRPGTVGDCHGGNEQFQRGKVQRSQTVCQRFKSPVMMNENLIERPVGKLPQKMARTSSEIGIHQSAAAR